MDGFVVGSSVGNFSTVGSLALQPTFEQLPFDSLTTTEPMGVSGNGELEPSPSTAPRNSVVRSIFEQQSSTVLPQPVQDLIQWTVQEINATVTKREIEEMKVLCEGNYSLDELKACYLSQRIESTSWKKQSWITVKYGISQFAAQYRTIIEAVEKLPTLPALITALGCDWEKLYWVDRFIWVAAIKKHEWDLTKAEVFLAYFKQTPKGKKGFAPTVADLRDHWETALEAEATLTETQQSLVSQLDAKGLHHAQSIRLVVADENEVRLQLAALPYRDMGGIESVSGWLITAIRNRYAIPEAIVKLQKRASDRVAVKEREEAELAAQEALWKAHGATYGEYLRRCERLIAERHPAEWTEFQVLHPDGQGDQYETYLWRFSRSGKSSLEVLFFTQWLEMFEAGKDPVQSCLKIVPLALDTLPVKTVTTDSSAVDRRAQQAQEMRDYREYLAACEVEIQRSHPDLYQQFLAKSQKDRDLIKSFPRMLTAFEEPEGHWQRFVQFFGRVAVVVQVQSCNTWAENKGN